MAILLRWFIWICLLGSALVSSKDLLSFHCEVRKYSNDYTGQINVTVDNEICMEWAKFTAFYRFRNEDFPEKSIKAAKNYCRNPFRRQISSSCIIGNGKFKKCPVPVCATIQHLGKASQTSTMFTNVAEMAVDGNIKTNFVAGKSCSATSFENFPMWSITFPLVINIVMLEIRVITKSLRGIDITMENEVNQRKCIKIIELKNGVTQYSCISRANKIRIMIPDASVYLIICYIKIYAIFKKSFCQDSQNLQGYYGLTNTTKSFKNCVFWKTFQKIIQKSNFMYEEYPENFCRPLLDPYNSWCFVEIKKNVYEKHYCVIEKCSENSLNCLVSDSSIKYYGFIGRASNGQDCQYWIELINTYTDINNYGSREELIQHKNFCRNFNDDPKGPWCYTIEYKNPKRYCNIPHCILASSFAQCSPKGCPSLVDNKLDCKIPFKVNSNPWFTLIFPYKIDVIAVILYSVKAEYFFIETSVNNVNWIICAAFYQSRSQLSKVELFKCTSNLKYIRISSSSPNFRVNEICQFQVLVNPPIPRNCLNSNSIFMEYFGTVSVDSSLRPCLYWTESISKYKYKLFNHNFLFNSPYKSKNYCRSPSIKSYPWCFVKLPNGRVSTSLCKVPSTCEYVILNVKCRNNCYSILMSSIPSCTEIYLKDLNIYQTSYGMPNPLIMPSATEDKSYFILVVSKYFEQKPSLNISSNSWNVEYLAKDVQGLYLKLGIFPLRKIELKKWMNSFSKNPQKSGWLYLLFIVLYSVEYRTDMNCILSFQDDTIDLDVLENYGYFEIVTTTPYFVNLT